MDSELQRLRFRVRQLEREIRALRSTGRNGNDGGDREPAAPDVPASFARPRVVNPWAAQPRELPAGPYAGDPSDSSAALPTAS